MSGEPEGPPPAREGAAPWIMHVVLPTLAGGILYLGWRTRGLLLWDWAASAGIEDGLGALRAGLLATFPAPPEWVRFSLPDALWVYGLTFSVARLQRESSLAWKIGWLSIPALFGPGAELLQAVALLPGTFDPLDLLLTALAFGAAVLFGMRAPRRERARAFPMEGP
jgi:hypothetical protein